MLKAPLLLAALALPAWLGAEEASLDVPQGVTLSVDSLENGVLVWDPIHRDDLMGYSVWMRLDKGEFTRLNIPTMVNKELKKLPMTTKGSLAIKGIGKRPAELKVAAEYESGRSEPSAAVFSKKARRIAAPSPAGATGDAEELSPSAKSVPGVASDKAEDDEPPQAPPPRRPDMAPHGKIQTSLGVGAMWEQTEARGNNSLAQLNISNSNGSSADLNAIENWNITYSHRRFEFPFSLEYGLLGALEIGGEVNYVNERNYSGNLQFGATSYTLERASAGVEGSGFGNPILKVRIQPSSALGLRLGFRANISSGGRSRLRSFGEYLQGSSTQAGLDDNDGRMEIKVDFGAKGNEISLLGSAGIRPASSETADAHPRLGPPDKLRAERGQELFGTIGYSFPWMANRLPGSLGLGISLRSIDPSRWYVNDQDAGPLIDKNIRAALRSQTGLNLLREDQFALFVEIKQNLYSVYDRKGQLKHAVDSGGKIEFTFKPDGYIVKVSGGFYY